MNTLTLPSSIDKSWMEEFIRKTASIPTPYDFEDVDINKCPELDKILSSEGNKDFLNEMLTENIDFIQEGYNKGLTPAEASENYFYTFLQC